MQLTKFVQSPSFQFRVPVIAFIMIVRLIGLAPRRVPELSGLFLEIVRPGYVSAWMTVMSLLFGSARIAVGIWGQTPTSPSDHPTSPSDHPTSPSDHPTSPSDHPTSPSDPPISPYDSYMNPHIHGSQPNIFGQGLLLGQIEHCCLVPILFLSWLSLYSWLPNAVGDSRPTRASADALHLTLVWCGGHGR